MAPQSSGSFIPKKTPGKPANSVSRGTAIGLFGYVSYIVFFGALFLSLGMFGLSFYIQTNLVEKQDELLAIQEDIQDSDIQEVIEFNTYLRSAEEIFAGSYTILPLLSSFEEVIADPVVLSSVELEREADMLELQVSAIAESFDATMFQRDALTGLSVLPSAQIENVTLVQEAQSLVQQFISNVDETNSAAEELEQSLATLLGNEVVTFTLQFDFNTSDIPFDLSVYDIDNPTVSEQTDSDSELPTDDSAGVESDDTETISEDIDEGSEFFEEFES